MDSKKENVICIYKEDGEDISTIILEAFKRYVMSSLQKENSC